LLRSVIGWCLLDSGMPDLALRRFKLQEHPYLPGAFAIVNSNGANYNFTYRALRAGIETGTGSGPPGAVRIPDVFLCGTELHPAEPPPVHLLSRNQSAQLRDEIQVLRSEVDRLRNLSDAQRAAILQMVQSMTAILAAEQRR
jgi:hypothetical protein